MTPHEVREVSFIVCKCGARLRTTAPDWEHRRFMKRHPKLCSERKAFAKQLAAGTRSVEDAKW